MDWWWQQELEDEGIHVLIHTQSRIVSRGQLLAAGWSDVDIRRRLRRRHWQTVHPGVYSTHTGPIGYDEQLVAALLYAGPDAGWSHYTAAEQFGLIKPDDRRPVHLTIPGHRRVRSRPNLVIHRDENWEKRLARVIPPRSTAAHAVLEIVDISSSIDEAAVVIAEACQSGRVSPVQILQALEDRRRLRYRRELRPILADVAAGSHSLLELRYLRDVERRHTACRPASGSVRLTRSSPMSPTWSSVWWSNSTAASTSRRSDDGATWTETTVPRCGPNRPCATAGSTSPSGRARPPYRCCRCFAVGPSPSPRPPAPLPAR
jgi:hypothetical protein